MKYRKELESIKTYEAGKPIELVVRDYGIDPSDVVKLASNENPFGTSAKVREKVASIISQLHRYPDDSYFVLKDDLAAKYSVKSENIIIGSGSDQIFEFITRAVLNKGDIVLQNKITFAIYAIYTAQEGGETIRTNTELHDLKAFANLLDRKPKLIYITTPSNPLGDAPDAAEVYEFLAKVSPETMVVIDAAYMEFAAFKDKKKYIDPKELITRFPNAIYTGTFSKAYGLGGMRVGYGVAEPKMIQELHKLRAPFNITTLSLAAAIEALKDQEFVQKTVEHNFKEMKKYEEFAKEIGLRYIESYTNFIALFFPDGKSASDMSQALLQKGMIVRDLKSYGLNAIRVTIGLEKENEKFFNLFREIWRR